MSKYTLAITALLLLGSNIAKAQSTEQVLGAIAGGALGSTIGQGDGRKAATVIGAIIGYRMGDQLLSDRDHDEFMQLNYYDLQRYCAQEVPRRYYRHENLRHRWISGCVQRLERQQKELEREAYYSGLSGQ